MWLAVRSLAWTVIIPGLVTIYIPWTFFGLRRAATFHADPVYVAGLLVALVGAAVMIRCIWEFFAAGRGTLSPLDPPTRLVSRGAYRYVRNPMYAGVLLMLIGEGVLTRSVAMLEYTLGWFVWINLVVLFYEEPALRRTFGASYASYASAVPRWLPRLSRS